MRPLGVLGPSSALICGQSADRVDLTLEALEECSTSVRGRLARVVARMECVGPDAATQGHFPAGGGF